MSEQPANPICEQSACITPTAPPPTQHPSANCRGFVPPGPWAAARAAARDTQQCSLAAPPPQHPRGTAARHTSPLPSISQGWGFSDPHLYVQAYFWIYFYWEEWKKKLSVKCLRPKTVIKINQIGVLKQISLICYQAGKKSPLKL